MPVGAECPAKAIRKRARPCIASFCRCPRGRRPSEIIEERIVEDKGSLVRDLTDEKVREYLANPVVSEVVKVKLTNFMVMNAKIAELQKRLAVQEKQLSQLAEDQARLRENLKIIPQTSDPYKKFLEKFVAQESEIEGYQKEIRQLQSNVQQQLREFEVSFGPLQPAPSPAGTKWAPAGLPQPQ